MYYVEWGDRSAMFDCFEDIEAWKEAINCLDEAKALAEAEKEKEEAE